MTTNAQSKLNDVVTGLVTIVQELESVQAGANSQRDLHTAYNADIIRTYATQAANKAYAVLHPKTVRKTIALRPELVA